MANEITSTISVNVLNGTFSDSFNYNGQITQAAVGASGGILAVPVTGADLPIGSVSVNGVLWLKNVDTTNYVEYGKVVSATFHPVGKLKAGEAALLRLATGLTLRCQSNTATCNLQFTLLEN